jgi:predicted nucleic acid-binding protein
MNLLLDSGIVGQLCHPKKASNKPVKDWLIKQLTQENDPSLILLPELVDYEVRRKLIHLVQTGKASQRSLDRLDELGQLLDYLPLDTETMRLAARLWAEARSKRQPSAAPSALDGDVILAALAILIGGTIITSNRKHLSRFVKTKDWTDVLAN